MWPYPGLKTNHQYHRFHVVVEDMISQERAIDYSVP